MTKRKPSKDRSNCCSAPVQVSTDDGTSFYVCDECHCACDLEVPCKLDLNGNPIDKETQARIDEEFDSKEMTKGDITSPPPDFTPCFCGGSWNEGIHTKGDKIPDFNTPEGVAWYCGFEEGVRITPKSLKMILKRKSLENERAWIEHGKKNGWLKHEDCLDCDEGYTDFTPPDSKGKEFLTELNEKPRS